MFAGSRLLLPVSTNFITLCNMIVQLYHADVAIPWNSLTLKGVTLSLLRNKLKCKMGNLIGYNRTVKNTSSAVGVRLLKQIFLVLC